MIKPTVAVLVASLALTLGCTQQQSAGQELQQPERWAKNLESFSEELEALQERLEMPGLAFAIVAC